MSYRAPVAEMVFAMRHVAGLDRAIAEELHGDLSLDLVETILEEAGKFANEELAPLNRSGDREGSAFKDGARRHAARLQGGLSRLGRGRLERAARSRGLWRPGPADASQLGLRRDVELGLHAFGLAPLLTMGGVEALAQHGSDELKRPLSRQGRLRRMDRRP